MILLPGLDGSGDLFSSFIKALPGEFTPQVVSFPDDASLGYSELENEVVARLEIDAPFIIVAESFSGPLAIRLAAKKLKNLVAVILCATFIKNPLPRMSRLIRLGIAKRLFKLPLPEFAIRRFLAGKDAPQELIEQCRRVIQTTNPETMASRFRAIVQVNASQELLNCSAPILYLCAKADKIVSRKSLDEIKALRPDVEAALIDAPHFLLQHAPNAAVAAIKNFLNGLLLFLILLGCGKKYDYIEPRLVATLQINFKDQSGSVQNTISLYSAPDKYSPERAWPLVVALHGYGDNAAAFHDLWKSVTDSLGFVLLTPQGEERTQEGFGWTWGSNAERAVQISIDIVNKAVHVDPKRIYLTGFSLGGSLCYKLGLKYPYIFHGIAPLGAPFDKKFLSENRALQNLRVYIGHGTLENNFSTAAQAAATVFQDLGAKVNLVPYEGIGHGLPEPKEKELAKILEFLDSKN